MMVDPPRTKPRLFDLAMVFARFGNFTFGGGSATVAVLREEIVARRQWLSTLNVDLSFALSRLTPGTNLLAFGTAVGWLLRGWNGALVALVAGSVPSAVIAVFVTVGYEVLRQNKVATIGLKGALAATVAVMFATGWTLIRPYYSAAAVPQLLVCAGGAFAFEFYSVLPPFQVLLIAAIVGFVWPQSAA